jgi:hypothetical protein
VARTSECGKHQANVAGIGRPARMQTPLVGLEHLTTAVSLKVTGQGFAG